MLLSAGLNRGVSHAVSAPAGSSPAALMSPAAHAWQAPPDTCSFSAHRPPHPDAVHESTEPDEPVNMSAMVAEPVSQQRVLLMLLSLNILLKVVADEISQHEMSWSNFDSLAVGLS